jgi:hypothetical protein
MPSATRSAARRRRHRAGDGLCSSCSPSSRWLEVAQRSDIGKVEVGQRAVSINAASGRRSPHVSSIGVLSERHDRGGDEQRRQLVVVSLDQGTDGSGGDERDGRHRLAGLRRGGAQPALRGSTVTLVRDGQRIPACRPASSATSVTVRRDAPDRVVITSTSALAGSATSAREQQRTGFGGGLGGGGFGGLGGGGFRARGG